LMMYLWLAEIDDRLEFARKERVGLEYLVGLRGLLEPLALGRPSDAPEVEAAAQRVDALNARLGTELQAAEPWRKLRQQLAGPSTGPAARVDGTVQLIAHVGDTSNLILDPDLDSYYLMDATVTLLPALVAAVSTIGGAPSVEPSEDAPSADAA